MALFRNFGFNETLSLTIQCHDQQEIDYYWNQITKAGKEIECGWCQDSYGIFRQIVPYNIKELVYDTPNAKKAFQALMKMKKIKIKELENA